MYYLSALILVLLTIHTPSKSSFEFYRHYPDDQSAHIWTIQIKPEIAKKFNAYKNAADDLGGSYSIARGYSTDQYPYLCHATAQKLFDNADDEKRKTVSISSPAEVEHMLLIANMLEANAEVKEALLDNVHAETFVHGLFNPQPKKWYRPFAYTILSDEDTRKDLQSTIIPTIIAESNTLKKRYKSFFYNLLYTCPEWKKADKVLEKQEPVTKTVEIGELNSPAQITYYESKPITPIVKAWQTSLAFTTYSTLYPEDCLQETYMHTMFQFQNMHNTSIHLRKLSKNCDSIFFTTKGGGLAKARIIQHNNVLQLPFIAHFIRYAARLYDGRSLAINVNSPKNTPLLIEPIDVQYLNTIHKNQYDSLVINCTLDACSLKALQACEPRDADKQYEKRIINFINAGKPIIDACKSLPNTYQNQKTFYTPHARWRYKIIEPWAVTLMFLGSMYIFYSSIVSLCRESLYNTLSSQLLQKIDAVNAAQTDYNFIASYKNHKLHEHTQNILNAKVIPCSNTYTDEEITHAFNTYKVIKNINVDYDDKKFCVGLIAFSTIAAGTFYSSVLIYNYIYKKYRPNAALYNPLKLLFPRRFQDSADYIPMACMISE